MIRRVSGLSGNRRRRLTRMIEIAPAAQFYYDRMTLANAIEIAKEMIDEWSYDEDRLGYCHDRPVLVRLVEAAETTV